MGSGQPAPVEWRESEMNLVNNLKMIRRLGLVAGVGLGVATASVAAELVDSINPMIDVPPTVSWPRVTVIAASNCSAVCTNFAEARACNPFLLTMSTSRETGVSSAEARGVIFR